MTRVVSERLIVIIMQKQVIVFFLLLSTILSACSKDPLSPLPTLATHKLELKPDTLRGQIFQNLSVLARIEGVPSSDIFYGWDYGDSNSSNSNSQYGTTHIYNNPGRYTLHAKAYQYFVDTLLAEDSIPVFITEPLASVRLLPKILDTIISANIDGNIKGLIILGLEMPLNSSDRIISTHITGVRFDTVFAYRESPYNNFQSFYFSFPRIGIYTVAVEVKKANGDIYGRDTSTVIIRLPSVTSVTLQGMSKVSVMLNIDSADALFHSPGFKNPLSLELPFVNLTPYHYSWSGNNFAFSYRQQSTGGGVFIDNDEQIAGVIAPDFQTITSTTVSVNDTNYSGTTSFRSTWGYMLRNLRLVSVTDKQIIYAAFDEPTNNYSSNVHFDFTFQNYPSEQDCANPITVLAHILGGQLKKNPSAYLIFWKN